MHTRLLFFMIAILFALPQSGLADDRFDIVFDVDYVLGFLLQTESGIDDYKYCTHIPPVGEITWENEYGHALYAGVPEFFQHLKKSNYTISIFTSAQEHLLTNDFKTILLPDGSSMWSVLEDGGLRPRFYSRKDLTENPIENLFESTSPREAYMVQRKNLSIIPGLSLERALLFDDNSRYSSHKQEPNLVEIQRNSYLLPVGVVSQSPIIIYAGMFHTAEQEAKKSGESLVDIMHRLQLPETIDNQLVLKLNWHNNDEVKKLLIKYFHEGVKLLSTYADKTQKAKFQALTELLTCSE